MFAAFAGVGVYTFHPPPGDFDAEIRDLNRREQAIRNSKAENELTAEDRQQIQEIRNERYAAEDAFEEAQRPWGRSTSILLMIIATLAMVVSLVRADQLPVISNGLLLGGVFTMLYGVGWIIATDTSTARFVVLTIALIITLGLGYVRFVRSGKSAKATGESEAADVEGLGDIELRLQQLEDRMREASRILGG
jgi:hypothetical protein